MLSDLPNSMQKLITQLLIEDRFKQAIEAGLKIYQIQQFKIKQLSPNQVFRLYYGLSTRFYFGKNNQNVNSWLENELRVYIWLLVGYSYLQKRPIHELTITDWQFFSKIFNNKNPCLIQFQALSVAKKGLKFLKWDSNQVALLDKIIKSKAIKNKWNQIAKDLFLLSSKKYFRTAKQCRQYWISHLDPKPLKSQWKLIEDYQLIKAIQQVGKKWAKVSKIFNGTRTQHMIKNRFKSLCQIAIKNSSTQNQLFINQDQLLNALQFKLNPQKSQQNFKKVEEKSQNKSIDSQEQQNIQRNAKLNRDGEALLNQILSFCNNKCTEDLQFIESYKLQGTTTNQIEKVIDFSNVQLQSSHSFMDNSFKFY